MKELELTVKNAIDEELIRAEKIHGSTFHDENHMFGVMYEEVHEALRDWNSVYEYFERFAGAFLDHDEETLLHTVEVLRIASMLCACELIQVSAMCEKTEAFVEECHEA